MRPPKYLPIYRSPSAFAAGSAATWFSVVKDGTVELSRLGSGANSPRPSLRGFTWRW
jgi:hypothetical protein